MEQSLVAWVNTFSLPNAISTLQDLSDGTILFNLITLMFVLVNFIVLTAFRIPEYEFHDITGTPLQKTLQLVGMFYRQELALAEPPEVDGSKVQQVFTKIIFEFTDTQGNKEEIVKLLENILGVMVECKSKAKFLHRVMEMDICHQEQLMNIIKNVTH